MHISFKKHTDNKLQDSLGHDERPDDKPSFNKTFSQSKTDTLKMLRHLAEQSKHVLITLTSIYPFDLFPDTVTIDENKVNIIKKELLGSEHIHSILIEDITNVSVSTGLLTATLQIVDSMNVRFPETYTVRHLNIKKAMLARRLIQGLMACKREGVDLSMCDNREIIESLEELGYAKGENLH